MKRTGICLEDIAAWHNLTRAVERAARGKRYRREVTDYLANLDANLAALQSQILDGSVPLGNVTRFHIRDPKFNTIQIKATASQKGRVGLGQRVCSGRLSRHLDIFRLTTRGLERGRRLGSLPSATISSNKR